jgi:hypothetical protein
MNEILVRRTWKRDSTTNIMPLHVAIENIVGNARMPDSNGKATETVKRKLMLGNVIETKLATFQVTVFG